MQNYKKYKFSINGKETTASLVAFDKDGVLFESKSWMLKYNTLRLNKIQSMFDEEFIRIWSKSNGVVAERKSDGVWEALDILPCASAYTATFSEEATILATFLMEHRGLLYADAREAAREIHEWCDAHADAQEIAVPRAGFPGIFRRLRESQIPYGVITLDIAERVRPMITTVDPEAELDFLISPSEIKHSKPAPDAIYKVSEDFGIAPQEILMIGDMVEDLQMANAAGAFAIGFPEGEKGRELLAPYADAMIDSFDEIIIKELV